VFGPKDAFASGKPSAGQLFGFLELARFPQGPRKVLSACKGIRMAWAQSFPPALQTAAVKIFSLRIVPCVQVKRSEIVKCQQRLGMVASLKPFTDFQAAPVD
jgi:hypothetical protein